MNAPPTTGPETGARRSPAARDRLILVVLAALVVGAWLWANAADRDSCTRWGMLGARCPRVLRLQNGSNDAVAVTIMTMPVPAAWMDRPTVRLAPGEEVDSPVRLHGDVTFFLAWPELGRRAIAAVRYEALRDAGWSFRVTEDAVRQARPESASARYGAP